MKVRRKWVPNQLSLLVAAIMTSVVSARAEDRIIPHRPVGRPDTHWVGQIGPKLLQGSSTFALIEQLSALGLHLQPRAVFDFQSYLDHLQTDSFAGQAYQLIDTIQGIDVEIFALREQTYLGYIKFPEDLLVQGRLRKDSASIQALKQIMVIPIDSELPLLLSAGGSFDLPEPLVAKNTAALGGLFSIGIHRDDYQLLVTGGMLVMIIEKQSELGGMGKIDFLFPF